MNIEYSIVVPVYGFNNRLNTLLTLIFSIKYYTKNTKLKEIIIVNNGGISVESLKPYLLRLEENNFFITIVDEIESGLDNARNIGLLHSTTDIVLFIDDDVLLLDNSIEFMINDFINKDVVVVGGKINLIFDHDVKKWIKSNFYLRLLAPQLYPDTFLLLTDPYYVFGGCMAVRKSALLHGFDKKLDRDKGNLLSGGDIDISLYFKEYSYVEPRSNFYTIVKNERFSYWFFIKRFYWQGVTAAILYKKYKLSLYDKDELFINNIFLKTLFSYLKDLDFLKIGCMFSQLIGFWLKRLLFV